MAYIGSAPTSVVSRDSAKVYRYTATAGQTVFSGADADNQILDVTPSDTRVHLNGLLLEPSDYNLTSSSVTLTTAASAGDELTVTGFQTFEVADTYTKATADSRYVNTTGDTISGNLIVDGGVALNPSSGVSVSRGSSHSNDFEGGRVTLKNGSGYTKQYGLDTYYENFRIFRENEDGTGGAVRFEIDAEGRVLMNQQPTFRGALNGHVNPGTTVASPGTTISSMHVYENIGNHWNNTTGTYTCPVAGKYQVSIFYIKYPVAGAQHVDLYKNGSIVTNARWRGEETASYNQVGGTVIISCSANDTLQWKEFGSAGIHSGNGTWSITYIG